MIMRLILVLLVSPLLMGVIEAKSTSFEVPSITVDNYDSEVLQSSLPVVVDLYANWCPPCRRMKKIVAKLAQKYEGKVKFFLLDVDRSKELRERFNLKCIPTFLFIKGGHMVEQQDGSLSEGQFEKKIQSNFFSEKGS